MARTDSILDVDKYVPEPGLLSHAAHELFALYGLSLVPSAACALPPKGRQVLGTIGFGGPDMKGALAILADESERRLQHEVRSTADPTQEASRCLLSGDLRPQPGVGE